VKDLKECICNSCLNLKGIIDESGAIEEYECEHGFPSDNCNECEDENICDATCVWYLDENENAKSILIKCMTCGKELEQICSNSEQGDVQCIDCFLNLDK
jgi:hypothetical protein